LTAHPEASRSVVARLQRFALLRPFALPGLTVAVLVGGLLLTWTGREDLAIGDPR